MLSTAPEPLATAGDWAVAIAAIIGCCTLIGGLVLRAWRRAAGALHEQMVETIRKEVPAAVAKELPRALEPQAAELRGQLVEMRKELVPNGGSSLRDQVDLANRRIGSLEAGQRKLFARLAGGEDDTSAET